MASILDFRSEHFFFLSIFDLQVTPKLPTPVRVNWPFSSEDAKNRFFTRWPPCHLGFPIGTILPTFNLPVTPMLPAKFRVSLPSASREEAKNRFSRWSTWWPSWMSNRTILAIFDLQVTPMLPTKFIKSISLSILETKQKIAFQNGRHGGHLDFLSERFQLFLTYKSTRCFLPSSESIGFSV